MPRYERITDLYFTLLQESAKLESVQFQVIKQLFLNATKTLETVGQRNTNSRKMATEIDDIRAKHKKQVALLGAAIKTFLLDLAMPALNEKVEKNPADRLQEPKIQATVASLELQIKQIRALMETLQKTLKVLQKEEQAAN
ncbi:hypothetical protein HYT45_03865 [Candidatus Uhrbacteria bacterium]|nr:hypothetical protein [Candidatus Uhrbacteria bacterium]